MAPKSKASPKPKDSPKSKGKKKVEKQETDVDDSDVEQSDEEVDNKKSKGKKTGKASKKDTDAKKSKKSSDSGKKDKKSDKKKSSNKTTAKEFEKSLIKEYEDKDIGEIHDIITECNKEIDLNTKKTKILTSLIVKKGNHAVKNQKKPKKSSGNKPLSGIQQPFYAPSSLCEPIGIKKGDIINSTHLCSKISEYAKENDLKGTSKDSGGKNGQYIKFDSTLKKILGTEYIEKSKDDNGKVTEKSTKKVKDDYFLYTDIQKFVKIKDFIKAGKDKGAVPESDIPSSIKKSSKDEKSKKETKTKKETKSKKETKPKKNNKKKKDDDDEDADDEDADDNADESDADDDAGEDSDVESDADDDAGNTSDIEMSDSDSDSD